VTPSESASAAALAAMRVRADQGTLLYAGDFIANMQKLPSNPIGRIVPERDPVALSRTIQELADDPELRSRLGRNAAEKYRSMFDCETIAGNMLELYRELVSRPRSA
jgi:glycosyltransferase involved in cell wall biosynthesis